MGGGEGGTSFLRTLAVRKSGAGKPSVRSGKWMVAKGKKKGKEEC